MSPQCEMHWGCPAQSANGWEAAFDSVWFVRDPRQGKAEAGGSFSFSSQSTLAQTFLGQKTKYQKAAFL